MNNSFFRRYVDLSKEHYGEYLVSLANWYTLSLREISKFLMLPKFKLASEAGYHEVNDI